MKHNLQISVSKQPQSDGIVACKQMTTKDKEFMKLLGETHGVMVILPGKTVQDITISEVEAEGGDDG